MMVLYMWRSERECMGYPKLGSWCKTYWKVGLHNMGSSKVSLPQDFGCTKLAQTNLVWLSMILVLNTSTASMMNT